MEAPKPHKNEEARMKDLDAYSILDTLPEADYDNITKIASEICQTPISLVSLVDDHRQWFKSHHGLEIRETAKEYSFCAHAIQQNGHYPFIIRDARKDERFSDNPLVTGDPYVIFYAGVPLESENGSPLGTLCVIDNQPNELSQDQIDSLKALSRQVMNLLNLRKKHYELENSLEALEEKNKNLENFALRAAHDIKSPLNNIRGLSEVLKYDQNIKLSKEGDRLVDLINTSTNKLKNMVDGLLAYSKSDKILKEEKTTIKLENLKEEVAGLFNHDHRFRITLTTDLDEIFANEPALEQILLNLVANAVKYNDKEEGKIDINVTENETEYEFHVKDNGPGIAPENQQKIFQLFETVAEKDNLGETGSGMGLATVKKLVEALGGTIQISSELGQGARFCFSVNKGK